MSDFTKVEFSTRDGVTLRGNFFRAQNKDAGVVLLMGGFSLIKEHFLGLFAGMFQQAGISALAFDPRTFGESDGMPRQEVNILQQAEDVSDAVTAAMGLPGVDTSNVALYGVGHGGGVALIAAANDPRIAAICIHAPFPSGSWDAGEFPKGLLELAWRDREEKTKANDTKNPTYFKVWRDWEDEKDGDRSTVMIARPAAPGLIKAAKSLSDAAGTPWANRVTMQSFINLTTTEPQDYACRVKQKTIYVLHENDPFAPSEEIQRKVFAKMGMNADLKVLPEKPGADFGEVMGEAVAFQIEWLKSVFGKK